MESGAISTRQPQRDLATVRPAEVEELAMDDEKQGKNDLVSTLYVVVGIPGIVVFLVLTFLAARSCNFAA